MGVDPPEESYGGIMSSHNNNTSGLINSACGYQSSVNTRGGQQIMPPSLHPSHFTIMTHHGMLNLLLDMDMTLMFVFNKTGGGIIQDHICHHNNGGVILRHKFSYCHLKSGMPLEGYLPRTLIK